MDRKTGFCDRILEIGIVPGPFARPVAGRRTGAAGCVCQGLHSSVELTMTVPGAWTSSARLAKIALPMSSSERGTVLNAESERRCLDAGAQCLVSSRFNLKLSNLLYGGKLSGPGRLTPTEVITAWERRGLREIFPCGQVG